LVSGFEELSPELEDQEPRHGAPGTVSRTE
jgi:hypothetical protein